MSEWGDGVLGPAQGGTIGLMDWVPAQDEPGHTVLLWYRASAPKNWTPPCFSCFL